MSGHSKWATIKHQKAAADKKRGQVFSKLSREISLAAREGSDPGMNFKLRLAMDKAKQANMPKDNIDRAINKGSGEGGKNTLTEVTYEGFGPAGVAVMVNVITDNKNRTLSELKSLFERSGGQLAASGAVSYLFKSLGLITLNKPDNWEEAALGIIDLGVENVEEKDGEGRVYTLADQVDKIAQELLKMNFPIIGKELVWEPVTKVSVSQENLKKVTGFLEALQEHDDVQKVFTNFESLT